MRQADWCIAPTLRRIESKIETTLLLAVALVLSTGMAQAAELVRVRGVIENATDTSVTVKTSDGKTQQVTLRPDTAFVTVVKSSLDKVGENTFIGTATKGDNPPIALEVVISPTI